MNRFSSFFAVYAFVLMSLIAACDEDTIDDIPEYDYTKGILFCNEGLYPNGAGSISFYDNQTGTMVNDIFKTANDRPLGNTVQSVAIMNNSTYIVVSGANRVEIVSAATFKDQNIMENLQIPRYLLQINDQKAYLTQWGVDGLNGNIAVVDILTNTVQKNIAIGKGPEMMVQVGNKVFVPCEGGYDYDNYDNRVAVINTDNDELITHINVFDFPNSIVADANGKVWVLCGGKVVYDENWNVDLTQSTKGGLVMIDPQTLTVSTTIEFPEVGLANNLIMNAQNNELYYERGGLIYKQTIYDPNLNTTPWLFKSYYGMAIDPSNNTFYGTDPKDYQSNGQIIRHLPSGIVVDTLTAGIIPNGSILFVE